IPVIAYGYKHRRWGRHLFIVSPYIVLISVYFFWLPFTLTLFNALIFVYYPDPGVVPYLAMDDLVDFWTKRQPPFVVVSIIGLLSFIPALLFAIPRIKLHINYPHQQILFLPNYVIVQTVCSRAHPRNSCWVMMFVGLGLFDRRYKSSFSSLLQ